MRGSKRIPNCKRVKIQNKRRPFYNYCVHSFFPNIIVLMDAEEEENLGANQTKTSKSSGRNMSKYSKAIGCKEKREKQCQNQIIWLQVHNKLYKFRQIRNRQVC